MWDHRYLEKLFALFGVLAILFAQGAVAAYNCPAETPIEMQQAADMPMGDITSPCDEIDTQPSSLCHEHCKYGQQSSAYYVMPPLMSAMVLPWVVVKYDIPVLAFAPPPSSRSPLTRATAPPISVQNCCFRV